MKLYLSSHRFNYNPSALLNFVDDNRNVLVLANSLDHATVEHRTAILERVMNAFRENGLSPQELDLRDFFQEKTRLLETVASKPLIWATGGDVFALQKAMFLSGFDELIAPLIKNGDIAYAGDSAGILIAAKDLFGAEITKPTFEHVDIDTLPKELPNENFGHRSLGLLDFYFSPHLNNKDLAETAIKHCRCLLENNKKVVALKDGEVFYMDSNEMGIITDNGIKKVNFETVNPEVAGAIGKYGAAISIR